MMACDCTESKNPSILDVMMNDHSIVDPFRNQRATFQDSLVFTNGVVMCQADVYTVHRGTSLESIGTKELQLSPVNTVSPEIPT